MNNIMSLEKFIIRRLRVYTCFFKVDLRAISSMILKWNVLDFSPGKPVNYLVCYTTIINKYSAASEGTYMFKYVKLNGGYR